MFHFTLTEPTKVPYGLASSGVLTLPKTHGADNCMIHKEAYHHKSQGVEFRCGLKYVA